MAYDSREQSKAKQVAAVSCNCGKYRRSEIAGKASVAEVERRF
jgi:hypothetical protein